MPDTATTICLDVAIKLNDPSQGTYTEAVVLPFVGMAGRELEAYLEVHDIPLIKQRTAALTVLALATELAAYPTDFLEPISLEERASGSTDLYTDMVEMDFEPDMAQDTTLRYWAFRDAKIKFLGATTDREIRLKYHRTTVALTTGASNVEPIGARLFLASRAAQMVEKDVMNSPTKAMERQAEVDETRDLILRRLVKNKQGVGVRRRGYKGYAI